MGTWPGSKYIRGNWSLDRAKATVMCYEQIPECRGSFNHTDLDTLVTPCYELAVAHT